MTATPTPGDLSAPCPECGEQLGADDFHYMLENNCCKCCYDDFHFGETSNEHE